MEVTAAKRGHKLLSEVIVIMLSSFEIQWNLWKIDYILNKLNIERAPEISLSLIVKICPVFLDTMCDLFLAFPSNLILNRDIFFFSLFRCNTVPCFGIGLIKVNQMSYKSDDLVKNYLAQTGDQFELHQYLSNDVFSEKFLNRH